MVWLRFFFCWHSTFDYLSACLSFFVFVFFYLCYCCCFSFFLLLLLAFSSSTLWHIFDGELYLADSIISNTFSHANREYSNVYVCVRVRVCVLYMNFLYPIDFSLLSALTRISFSFKECIIMVSLKVYLTVSEKVWIIVLHIDDRIHNNSQQWQQLQQNKRQRQRQQQQQRRRSH